MKNTFTHEPDPIDIGTVQGSAKSISSSFICKYCGKENELTEALSAQIKHQLTTDITQKHQDEIAKLKQQIVEESNIKLQDLLAQIKEKDQSLEKMRDAELELRKEKRAIEEEKKEMALKVQREIDEKSAAIEQKAFLKAKEEDKLRLLEQEKKIDDLRKSLEEAQRKANQGSQQSQGEVVELDLEQTLRNNFPDDEIIPVEKGVRGADIKQIVRGPRGFVCGIILWEVKQTKTWTEGWVEKLKADLRNEKAHLAVIATAIMPKEITTSIGNRNGVWLTSFSTVLIMAQLLRNILIDSGRERAKSLHRGSKAETLYEYVNSHEFVHQIEAMVDVYLNMKKQITKERIALESIWKMREKQVDQLLNSTSNIAGSISGITGQLQIKGLELLELEDGK